MGSSQTESFEKMIGAISRLLKNGEMVVTGTLSPLPAAVASWPNIPMPRTWSPCSMAIRRTGFPRGSTSSSGLPRRGRWTCSSSSGLQIDRQGSINLSVVGDYDHPKLRLPGGAGSAMLYSMSRRTILFTMTHTKKLFVPKVDFRQCHRL